MNTKTFEMSRRALMKLTGAAVALSSAYSGSAAATKPAAELFLTDTGTGKNLMLLHGWSCDSHDWSWQLPVFESKYRVVAVDLRGHGRSQVMPSGGYAPEDYVNDIEALMSGKYAGQKFIVMGHSMGGQIAARLAAKRPDLVTAVVSVDGSLGFSEEVASVFKRTADDLQVSDPGVVGPALFKSAYDAATSPAMTRWHARRLQGTPTHVVRESFGPLFFGPDQVGIGKASEDFCIRLTVPLYHLCRDQGQAERMQNWFSNPKSKVDVWSNAGHWIMQDRPEDTNKAVTAWVDSL
ncbi:alpha/beta hydrolase [Mesorhizobium sp. NZP2234]|jgi:pimeloyl-ACP methyl ester carboxylesterase|uniref:alpha/beta fold hydrolase n=1 Tax=Mesorhizobium sp. NZP2234 TaxID=2483402 RepID=UPI0015581F29|nr:alpha/beta hydrolase [Mesorhizobium sp. NZP2234]QKC91922.1 alpha/beta hydrolase [Mesorhizobium sp. NZP2234]